MYKKITAKTMLNRMNTKIFGIDYNINVYRGCNHGCIYCDSMSRCYGNGNFKEIKVKINAEEVLERELEKIRKSGVICTGYMSDPYNEAERELLISRRILNLISLYGFGCAVITKSSLLLRDTDLLIEISKNAPVVCMISITTSNNNLAKLIEPEASSVDERFKMIEILSQHGIKVGVLMTPVLPYIEDNEENIREIIEKAYNSGAYFVYTKLGVTLRDNQKNFFLAKLREIYSDNEVYKKYIKNFKNKYYCYSENKQRLWEIFTEECKKKNLLFNMNDIAKYYKAPYEHEQLSFWRDR